MFDGPESREALKARIQANLTRVAGRSFLNQFNKLNPHLVGERVFEDRWGADRQDAAVLIPIIPREAGATVLLTVRSSTMPSHAGQISFPGGKVQESDASRVETALREAHEEVSIAPASVEVIGELGIHLGGLGFSVTPVIGLVDPQAEIRACPREVDEIFEAPLAHFMDLSNHIIEEREHKGVFYNTFAAPYQGYHVWGLTAGILRSFAELFQPERDGS